MPLAAEKLIETSLKVKTAVIGFALVWHDQPAIGVFRSVQPLGLAGKAQDGIRGGIGIFRDFAAWREEALESMEQTYPDFDYDYSSFGYGYLVPRF